jgi:hypothetical protein
VIQLPEVFYDERARDGTWCRLRYPGHPRGCPNFPKCPAKRPDFQELTDRTWYAVVEKFDLKAQAERMAKAHPEWTERQCRNLLYWQGGVRNRLKAKALKIYVPFADVLLDIPEANGVNIFQTMARVGIHIELEKPDQITKVMLVGKPSK